MCVLYWIVLIVMYVSLQEFEKVLKQKQVELRGEVGTEECCCGTGEGEQLAKRQCVSVSLQHVN